MIGLESGHDKHVQDPDDESVVDHVLCQSIGIRRNQVHRNGQCCSKNGPGERRNRDLPEHARDESLLPRKDPVKIPERAGIKNEEDHGNGRAGNDTEREPNKKLKRPVQRDVSGGVVVQNDDRFYGRDKGCDEEEGCACEFHWS